VPEEAAPLVAKDKKNFGVGKEFEKTGVIAVTLNAVLINGSAREEATDGKAGGKGYKKPAAKGKANAKPKIGAKVEKLPPPTGEAASEAIVKYKATLALVSNALGVKEGQQALLLAFESWLCSEINEPVLPEAPKLLKTLCDEGLLDKELLADYWTKVKSTHALDVVELLAAQSACKEADAEHAAASEQLKEGQKEDAAQQAKWAAACAECTDRQPTHR